MKENLRTFTEV